VTQYIWFSQAVDDFDDPNNWYDASNGDTPAWPLGPADFADVEYGGTVTATAGVDLAGLSLACVGGAALTVTSGDVTIGDQGLVIGGTPGQPGSSLTIEDALPIGN